MPRNGREDKEMIIPDHTTVQWGIVSVRKREGGVREFERDEERQR